jgi:hypothetical protein
MQRARTCGIGREHNELRIRPACPKFGEQPRQDGLVAEIAEPVIAAD